MGTFLKSQVFLDVFGTLRNIFITREFPVKRDVKQNSSH
ncbi:hypothetical protein UF75_0493 [Desulfosporosinus sp. I2]|nr:hypothetical protein UF75_0493 [Desulfosporosinus sp. I2]